MSSRRPLINKITYLILIAVLLIPLSLLSRPARQTSSGEIKPGGKLAQLRTEYGLSQANLGEIDPTSETIRLATLGMRGIAANILWMRANEYKKVEDWTNLSATVEQITKLQPNFFKVWDFQAHNLSYNISVEFDDYRDRYKWVIKGIEFFKEGQKYNQTDPRFERSIGWFIGQKIGRADENKQFRELFRKDDDFHGDRRPSERDNWLVIHEWFKRAEAKVKDPTLIRGTSPVLFYSEAAKALINFAEALENDGRFGDVTKTAWQKATDEFLAFGERIIPTSFGFNIRLSDQEAEEKRAERAAHELDKLAPGVREQIKEEKTATLTDREREALAEPDDSWTPAQFQARGQAFVKTSVSHREVADRAPPDVRERAHELAVQAIDAREVADVIGRYRGIVNFEYWRARSQAGFEEEWQQAQKSLFEAEEHLSATRFPEARVAYETAFENLRVILDKYPELRIESITLSDIFEDIQNYQKALAQDDLEFPKDFVLQDVVDQVGGNEQMTLEEAEKLKKPSGGASDTQQPDATPAAEGDETGESSEDAKADAARESAANHAAPKGDATPDADDSQPESGAAETKQQ